MAYDNNQASVLVVSHLEYIRTQQFEYLKRLRAHFLRIDPVKVKGGMAYMEWHVEWHVEWHGNANFETFFSRQLKT